MRAAGCGCVFFLFYFFVRRRNGFAQFRWTTSTYVKTNKIFFSEGKPLEQIILIYNVISFYFLEIYTFSPAPAAPHFSRPTHTHTTIPNNKDNNESSYGVALWKSKNTAVCYPPARVL